MSALTLEEHRRRSGVLLSREQARAIARSVPSLTVSQSASDAHLWDLTPGSHVGSVTVDDLALHIRPKIGLSRLLFMLSYATNGLGWRDEWVDLDTDTELVDVVLEAFARALRSALGRGVLRGYRVKEDALPVVRGRIDVAEQIRRRQGRVPPIHVVYDDHTEDILPNRLLRAALWRSRVVGARSWKLLQRLAGFERMLGDVALVEFDPRDLPAVRIDRLNQHYEPALALAALILRSTSLEDRSGSMRSSAFLVDMNRAFEDFVIVALREELRLSPQSFPQGAKGNRLHLDEGDAVRLRPDLSWWVARECLFVGDVKYKRTDEKAAPNADVYQLVAYTVALDLPHGLLVYAAGEHDDVTYDVRNLGKQILIRSLDVSGGPDQIRSEIRALADLIRSMRRAPEGIAA